MRIVEWGGLTIATAVCLNAGMPAVDDHWGDGPFLLAADIPVGAVRTLRDKGSEVWPGAWSAAHVMVNAGL